MATAKPAAPSAAANRALLIGVGAVASVLLVPTLFSDPNGVDPYALRIAAVTLLILMATYRRRARWARPYAVALATLAVPYSVFAAGPAVLSALLGARAPAPIVAFALANGAQFVLAVGFAALAVRGGVLTTAALRPRVTAMAVLAAVGGVALLVLAGWAIPAGLLGRIAVQPALLAAQGPALVMGDVLQGATQEVQFRGVLLGTLEIALPPRRANALQALLFAGAHLAFVYQGPIGPFIPVTAAVGWALGWLTQRIGSLWPAVIIHAVADVLVDVVVVPGLYGT